jgi:pimeloyl-ACP methyl ester carboxylesterase
MGRDRSYRPTFPTGVVTDYYQGAYGRMRSRTLGVSRPGVPEIVMVQGMTVSDYLLPGLGALSDWTRTHLIDLPGCSGSGEPPHEMTVGEFADAVAGWLATRQLEPVLLAGQSSGTQVAAEAALRAPEHVVGVVLVGPTVDPAARRVAPVLRRWWIDRSREPVSLDEVHAPERKRVGFRRLWHVLRVHLDHAIEEPVLALRVPVLVIAGRDDPISPPSWARRLAMIAAEGCYVELPGPHSFCWRYPDAWSAPIHEFARSSSETWRRESHGQQHMP